MSFLSNLFRRKPYTKRGNIESFMRIFKDLNSVPGVDAEKAGGNLAVLLNNAGISGIDVILEYLSTAPDKQIKQLADWICTASEEEIIEAAGFFSRPNAN